jgi:hypothetical protein
MLRCSKGVVVGTDLPTHGPLWANEKTAFVFKDEEMMFRRVKQEASRHEPGPEVLLPD